MFLEPIAACSERSRPTLESTQGLGLGSYSCHNRATVSVISSKQQLIREMVCFRNKTRKTRTRLSAQIELADLLYVIRSNKTNSCRPRHEFVIVDRRSAASSRSKHSVESRSARQQPTQNCAASCVAANSPTRVNGLARIRATKWTTLTTNEYYHDNQHSKQYMRIVFCNLKLSYKTI